MIGYLEGTARGPRTLVTTGGVGYDLETPTGLPDGEHTSVWVHTAVSENAITLYGFADVADRDTFRALLAVQGVGGKAALALLRDVGAAGIADAVAAGDPKPLTAASGIGPKAASRILASLDGATLPRPADTSASPGAELAGALINLGVDAAAAGPLARKVIADSPDESFDVQLRTALIAAS